MAEITFEQSGPGSMNFQWLKPGEMYLSTKKVMHVTNRT